VNEAIGARWRMVWVVMGEGLGVVMWMIERFGSRSTSEHVAITRLGGMFECSAGLPVVSQCLSGAAGHDMSPWLGARLSLVGDNAPTPHLA
jgi:hypothetical protein